MRFKCIKHTKTSILVIVENRLFLSYTYIKYLQYKI
nr:MAG TPA: hypothetical protein [Caudoviricetes sp.]